LRGSQPTSVAAMPTLRMPANGGLTETNPHTVDIPVVTNIAGRYLRRWRLAALLVTTLSALLTQTVMADDLYPYPFPYERNAVKTFVNSYSTYPYSTIGKLFFDDPQTKTPKQCSASVINAPNKSLVFTAAHCIHSGGPNGHFYDFFMFVPQDDNGSAPFGGFTWRAAYVPTVWTNNGDFMHDYGFVIVNRHNGSYLQDAVGSLGWIYNAPEKTHWHIEGYPSGGGFTGGDMVECMSSYASNGEHGETIGAGCDMAAGAFGGPWITNFSGSGASGHNMINGVSSYTQSNPSQREAVYGPLFNDDWYNQYSYVNNK
jgi:V8-like Glu-specific endopeptidase